jgi:hypothetical protein
VQADRSAGPGKHWIKRRRSLRKVISFPNIFFALYEKNIKIEIEPSDLC